MKLRVLFVVPVLVLAAVLSACAGSAAPSPTQAPQKSASIAQVLQNVAYPIELVSAGTAQLQNGSFEQAIAPGSATKLKIQLGSQQVFGDINGDGAEDAAVTLLADPGGSGTFTYLAVVLNDKGTAKPVDSVLLGDRIVMKSLAIQSGSILVNMLTRRPDEPMSAQPTVAVTWTFRLQGDKLVEQK